VPLAAGCADPFGRLNRTIRCSLLCCTSLLSVLFGDRPAAGFASPSDLCGRVGVALALCVSLAASCTCAVSLAASYADGFVGSDRATRCSLQYLCCAGKLIFTGQIIKKFRCCSFDHRCIVVPCTYGTYISPSHHFINDILGACRTLVPLRPGKNSATFIGLFSTLYTRAHSSDANALVHVISITVGCTAPISDFNLSVFINHSPRCDCFHESIGCHCCVSS
jgi:hypothetical protein